MANFNTNQARHFYVAKAKKDTAAAVSAVGDLALLSDADGDLYLLYKNGDGILTRSDTIPAGNIEYCNVAVAADMATKLLAHTIALDTTTYPLASNVGKTFVLTVNLRGIPSYDEADTIAVSAAVTITSAINTAALFNKALAKALVKALSKRQYPYLKVFIGSTEITRELADASYPASGNLVLVEAAQKYRRGLMANEPIHFTTSFNVRGGDEAVEPWGTDTVAASAISGNTTIPAAYVLADLEHFCYGERGDIYRGSTWPNNYEPTYLINPADTTTSYDVLTIQYFWQGHAENIQKSPRTIQIAGATADIAALKALVDAAMGVESASGSGSV